MNIHVMARTTPLIRQEIKKSTLSQRALAEKYNVTRSTVQKWQKRESVADKSHRPDHLQTTLNIAQEAIVIEIRKTLFLPLDDLLVVTREFLHPKVSRAGLARCLKRHGVSNLNQMKRARAEELGEEVVPPKKTFKDYEPGFVHVDVKYLPKMQDQESRGYLLVGIDRATRWVYMEVVAEKTAENAKNFLKRLIEKAHFKVQKVLTDNGKEFTDRFIPNGERKPTGNHKFDQVCAAHGIEHRLIKPRYPQTNGMVERFNGRISDIVKTTHFDCADDLKRTMVNYMQIYNHEIPQKALGHISPIDALKQWAEKKPDLFVKSVYKQTRPDRYTLIRLFYAIVDIGERNGSCSTTT
jgi:transposase InsO family protein